MNATLRAVADATFGDRYSDIDRVRDFRGTFFGDDYGLRTLALLARMTGWIDVRPPTHESMQMTAYWEGRRSVFYEIQKILDDETQPFELVAPE